MFMNTYDAIVVGARCAGAATAMLMACKGLRVLMIERDQPGTDTLSTHNLTRGAVKQLVRWGLADSLLEQGTPPIHRTTFTFEDEVLPLDLKPVGNVPGLLGTRRFILDATLVKAAHDAGVHVCFQTSFRDVIRNQTDRVIGATLTDTSGNAFDIQSPLVVGADGIHSTVARRVGAAVRKQATHTLGHIYGYYRGLPLADNHVFFGSGVAASSTVTNGDASVVVASATPERLRQLRSQMEARAVLEWIAEKANPRFGALLKAVEITETVRVFSGTKGFVRDCSGPGWALVGDAGYFRDPMTAHGITDAFRDAELLANAAGCGDHALVMYEKQRDEVTTEIWKITDRIAGFHSDLNIMKSAYRDLAHAMRAEQEWMAARFDPARLAA